jgi:hypothetical protein
MNSGLTYAVKDETEKDFILTEKHIKYVSGVKIKTKWIPSEGVNMKYLDVSPPIQRDQKFKVPPPLFRDKLDISIELILFFGLIGSDESIYKLSLEDFIKLDSEAKKFEKELLNEVMEILLDNLTFFKPGRYIFENGKWKPDIILERQRKIDKIKKND